MKNKINKIIPLILCFVMVAGSCLTVNAAKISASKLYSGDSGYFGYNTKRDDSYGAYLFAYKVNTASDDVYAVPYMEEFFVNDKIQAREGVYLISKAPFNYSYCVKSNSRDEPCFYTDFSIIYDYTQDSKTVTYDGTTYYYCSISRHHVSYYYYDEFDYIQPSSNFIKWTDFSPNATYDNAEVGVLFHNLYLADFTWDDGNDTEPDLDNGFSNYSLGYLNNLKTRTLNVTGSSRLYKQILWDNNHAEWDESYKVAHYVKFKGYLNSYLGELREFESDLIYLQKVPFSDCKSQYDMLNGFYKDKADEFREYLESEKKITDQEMTIQTHEYLIICRETENGTEYGYWNVLRSQDHNDKIDESIYGTIDSNGNFTEIKNNGQIENSVGKGDSVEDAENNSQTLPPPVNNTPSLDKIGDFMEYFTDMMSSLFDSIGALPKYLAEFFSFLPSGIITTLSLGLLVAIILRIVGR